MKKVILAMAVIAISTATVNAQGRTNFGVKAGMTSANLKFSGFGANISTDSKIGFYGGVFAEIGISENFAVQPELLYSLLGAKSSDATNGDDKINLSYVSVPVLAKYIKDGLSIVLGPQIGFLVSAKEKTSGSNEDVKDDFETTDISGVIGAGYTTISGFGFDARYQLGLSNIAKDSGGGKLKNNAFMFGVHYRFHH
ncbi:MAG: porin family protein [Ginsengibacter sp.]